jgi:hypothetical protein
MATTHLHSIGTTGRDYSTLQAWEDACPANLVTADEVYKGECYNDSEFTAGVTISGPTVDATRYIELTVAAGQSFQDHADVRTNPLRYDQTKGVGIYTTTNYTSSIVLSSVSYTRLSRLQVKCLNASGKRSALEYQLCMVKDCIFDAATNDTSCVVTCPGGGGSGSLFTNCVIIPKTSGGYGLQFYNGITAIGCTVVKPSDITAGGVGLVGTYGSTNIAQSCAVFGFTTGSSGAVWDTTNSKNNATDLASGLPGTTGNVYNVTYNQTTPFTDADKDSLDLRAVAATALAGAGYRDSTNAPNDISGTARSATPTIGAWELAAAAAATFIFSEIPRGIRRGIQRGMMRFLQ